MHLENSETIVDSVDDILPLPVRYELVSVDRKLVLNNRPWYFEGRVFDHLFRRSRKFQSAIAASLRNTNLARIRELNEIASSFDCRAAIKYLDAGCHRGHAYQIFEAVETDEIPIPGPANSRLRLQNALKGSLGVLNVLEHLHRKSKLHNEVFLSSVFLERDLYRLSMPGLLAFAPASLLPSDYSENFALHASPELAGTIEHDLGPASDLYSFGITLFQLLSGQAPFRGDSASGLLLQHATSCPAWELLGDVPDVIVELLQRLLRKNPAERYQTATAVQNDIRNIVKSLRHDSECLDTIVLGQTDQRASMVEPSFVGRKKELAEIRTALGQTIEGGTVYVCLAAPSGFGSTRFVQEAIRTAGRQGFRVLQATAKSELPERPFRQLDEIAKQFLSVACLNDQMREELLPFQAEIAHALPELATSFFGWSKTQEKNMAELDQLGEKRVRSAICRFFKAMGGPHRPTLIWLDECQWLDQQTLDVLAELTRCELTHTLFIFSMRAEHEEARREFERKFPARIDVNLEPLIDGEIRELVQSMAGKLPDSAIEEINRLSDGSPFVASAVLRGMVESGAIYSDGEQWVQDEEKMISVQASDSAADVLSERIESLPTEELEILKIGAVAGIAFLRETIVSLIDEPDEVIAECLRNLRKLKLIWKRPDGRLAFAHNKLREIMLGRISPEKRQPIHLRIAEWYLTELPSQNFQIAYHFHHAGLPERGLENAVLSAEESKSQFSFDCAEQQYRIADAGLARLTATVDQYHPLAYRIHSGLADTLLLQGRWREAESRLDMAKQVSESNTESAWVEMKMGELCFKRGSKARSIPFFELGLRKLGQTIPKKSWQIIPSLFRELTVQILHSLFGNWLVNRMKREPDSEEQLALNLLSKLTHAYWFCNPPTQVIWAHLRGLNQAERFSDSLQLAQFYSDHGPAMSLIPWFKRGLKYARKSLEMRKKFQNLWGQGQSEGFIAMVQYAATEFVGCIERATSAEKILEEAGDVWETNIARYHLAASKYYLGQHEEAVAICRDTYQRALASGDFQSTGNILDVWARSSDGDISIELIKREQNRSLIDFQRDCHLRLAEGICLLRNRQFRQAVCCLKDGINISKTKGIVNAYTIPCHTWWLTAKRCEIQHRQQLGESISKRDIKKLCGSARRTLQWVKRFRNELPRVYHELGHIYALLDDAKSCQRTLQAGMHAARVGGCKAELEQLRATYFHFGNKYFWFDELKAEHYRPEDISSETIQKEHTTFSLVDQFDTLLDSGRQILAAETAEAVIELTRNSAVKLLRAQTGVVLNPGSNKWDTIRDTEFSIDVVNTVLTSKKSATHSFGRSTAGLENQQRFSGSHLCSPIRIGNKLLAMLYVKNENFPNYYGEESVRIADYLVNAAEAALEKIDSFGKLEELNQHLEERVASRTAALEAKKNDLQATADLLRQTQSRLKEAHDVANRANDAKSQFLAKMSHEMRTPLSAIKGFTELILRGTISDPMERRKKLETVRANSQHLLNLINELLDLSKVEAEKLELERMEFSPGQIVVSTFESLRSKSVENNVDFRLTFETDIPATIDSDPTRMKQVLTNLLGNAIKFSKNSRVELKLSATKSESQNWLRFEIVDGGIGMTEDQLAKIFNPFVQADASTTRQFGGSGLGLTITKKLVELMDGKIKVESQPHRGSTFTVEIPFVDSGQRFLEPDKVMNEHGADSELSWNRADLSGVRILVADDVETNLELIDCIFRDTKAEITPVTNGQMAVNACQYSEFDLVLMDMQMPIMDGLTATTTIRGLGCKQPIIALTANKMKGDEERILEAGCSAYVSKPIDINLLIKTVCNFVGREFQAIVSPMPESNSIANVPIALAGFDLTNESVNPPWHRELPDHRALRELARTFIKRSEGDMVALLKAQKSAKHDLIGSIAHRLKGTAGSFGFDTMSQLARRLEQFNQTKDLNGISSSISELICYLGLSPEWADEMLQPKEAASLGFETVTGQHFLGQQQP